ncbi:hypothetical protein RLIN73S_01278 [Rhodanobacter lindaniclasticus]
MAGHALADHRFELEVHGCLQRFNHGAQRAQRLSHSVYALTASEVAERRS